MIRNRSVTMIFVLVTACHSASPRISPEPEIISTGKPLPASEPLSAATRWVVQPSPHAQRYRSTTIAIIDLDNEGSTARDSSLSTTEFSLAVTREGKTASYSATVEASSSSGSGRSLQRKVFPNLPFSFAGHIVSGRLTFDTDLDCDNEISSIAPLIQRALIISPLQLQKEMTWADSTDTSICGGPVPVSLTTVKSYRVKGETRQAGIPAILLERQDRTVSAGEGTEGQHRVQIRSQGSSHSNILLDVQTGALLDMTTVNVTTVTVTVSGRTQRFVQSSHEHIARY